MHFNRLLNLDRFFLLQVFNINTTVVKTQSRRYWCSMISQCRCYFCPGCVYAINSTSQILARAKRGTRGWIWKKAGNVCGSSNPQCFFSLLARLVWCGRDAVLARPVIPVAMRELFCLFSRKSCFCYTVRWRGETAAWLTFACRG